MDTEEMWLRATQTPSQRTGRTLCGDDADWKVSNKQTGFKRQMARDTDGMICQTVAIDMQEGNDCYENMM